MRQKYFSSILLLLAVSFCCESWAQKTEKPVLDTKLSWDFDGPEFKFSKSFYIQDNGFKPQEYAGGKLPRPRVEGKSLCETPMVSVVKSREGDGNAIKYTLAAQDESYRKARAEHYLVLCDFGKEYISDFSMMIDENFTPIDAERADGGPSWCILRQWHQSAPESPVISLFVDRGESNKLYVRLRYGDCKGVKDKEFISEVKDVKLGEWYNFRFNWKVVSGSDDAFCKVYVSQTKDFDELGEEDVWLDYEGKIGYTLKSRSKDERSKLAGHVKEHVGLYQNAHLAPDSYHAVSYDNITISEVK